MSYSLPKISSHSVGLRTLSISSDQPLKRSAEEQLHDTFAEVLSQVGRQGYQSAQQLETSTSLDDQILASWEFWFDSVSASRYSFEYGSGSPSVKKGSTPESVKHDFGQILYDAYHNGGYANPKEYLRSMSSDQLKTIQQVQHLADPIDPTKLSEEASLNLLLPPDTQVDCDCDGFTSVGIAYTFRFPDSNTPQPVRQAWEQAAMNLSEGDRLTMVLQMMLPIVTANIHTDADGRYLRSSNPGDADWTNPMARHDFSYTRFAQDRLDYLDYFQSKLSLEQYSLEHKFWTTFKNDLSELDQETQSL